MATDDARRYDAIVLGGGHNGLVAAAYLGGPALRTLVLERRERVGGAADTDRARARASASRRCPHGRPAAAVGRPRPRTCKAPRPVARRARTSAPSRPQPDGRRVALWARPRRGPPRACAPGRAHDADALRRLRPAGPRRSAGSSPTSAARRRRTSRRPGSATRWPGSASGGRSAASAATTAGRSCGSCRWRSPTSSPSRSRPTRSGRPSPGAASSTPRWARGRPGTTAVLLADSAGNDGGAAGETVFARGGPGALAAALAAAARAAGGEIRTGAEVVAVTSRDGRATGVVARRRRGDRGAGRRRAASTRSGPDAARRSRSRSGRACAGGPATSGRPGTVAKVNLVLAGLPGFPAAGDDAAAAPRPDPRRDDRASTRSSGPSTPPSTAGRPTTRASRRRSRRSSTRRSSTGAPDGHAGHERHRPVGAAHAARRDLGRPPRGARRPRRRGRSRPVRARARRALVTARQVLTPLDLERDYGLTGGHPLHAEHGLDQFFLWRPLLGHARYRMPARRPLPGRLRRAPGRRRHRSDRARTPPARSSSDWKRAAADGSGSEDQDRRRGDACRAPSGWSPVCRRRSGRRGVHRGPAPRRPRPVRRSRPAGRRASRRGPGRRSPRHRRGARRASRRCRHGAPATAPFRPPAGTVPFGVGEACRCLPAGNRRAPEVGHAGAQLLAIGRCPGPADIGELARVAVPPAPVGRARVAVHGGAVDAPDPDPTSAVARRASRRVRAVVGCPRVGGSTISETLPERVRR